MTPTDSMNPADAADIPHGGRLLADALSEGGIEVIFGLAGEHVLPLFDGCLDAGIRVIDCRHEGAAALAAEGWAWATGDTGVAAVTAGPGFGNALIGLLDAGVWTVPMVLIAGRTGSDKAGRGAVMDVDQLAVASPVAKWAVRCGDPQRLAPITGEALYRARSGRPGPVYLEVPQDVMRARSGSGVTDIPQGFPGAPPAPSGALEDLEEALDALERAKRPIVLAGSGAHWARAGAEIARFCETAQIPVTTTSAARGVVPDSHPWCLGGLVHGGAALLSADVVLILGSAFNGNLMFGRPPLFNLDQKIIQVDIEPESIGGNRRADIAVVGDVRRVVRDLESAWRKSGEARQEWIDQSRASVEMSRGMWDEQIDGHASSAVHPGGMARAVVRFARDAVGDDVTFITDGGDANVWGLAYAYAEGPGRLMTTTTALGTLGVGVPYALAAKAARPGDQVMVIAGDGAFGLSAMEIDTAVRHDLPFVAVISNNAAWGDVAHVQDRWYGPGRRVGSELAPVRYDTLAEALGGHGEHVTTLDELRPALERSIDSGKPAVVDVATDPGVLSDLLRNIADIGLM